MAKIKWEKDPAMGTYHGPITDEFPDGWFIVVPNEADKTHFALFDNSGDASKLIVDGPLEKCLTKAEQLAAL